MPTDELINTHDHVNHLVDVRDTLKESDSFLVEA
jgi:hypothetical protein